MSLGEGSLSLSLSVFHPCFLSLSALSVNKLLLPVFHISPVYVFNSVNRRRFVLEFLLSSLLRSPSPLSPTHGLHEQKHLGKPSSRLGGVPKGGPGGALRARCAFFFFFSFEGERRDKGGGVHFTRRGTWWNFFLLTKLQSTRSCGKCCK